jgi:uncharacterized radical SAM superfamily Fe-S cluster-containing enzyme
VKYCPDHGQQTELLEENAAYHLSKRNYDKPGNTMKIQTEVKLGCPYDCGICPQHDQHACIGLIEVTTRCNLNCPLCYASAGEGTLLSLETIGKMIDFFIDAENGNAEILQVSGGEPTLHPEILTILKMAKDKGVKYVMLNTNGVRLADDEAFVASLAPLAVNGGFEVYLQFDGFKESTYQTLRGRNLLEIKKRAIANLAKHNVPVTLVMSIAQGVNDDEIGEVFLYGLNTPGIRGINYQPVAYFGRFDVNQDLSKRVTLSGVLERLEKQSAKTLRMSDFIPLPCNVERVAITYLYKNRKGEFTPITRDVKFKNHLQLINNTFVFTLEDALKNAGASMKDFKTTCDCFNFITDFRHMVPLDFFVRNQAKKKEYIDQNTFRISVSSFIDALNFDSKSMQKECVHVVTEDLRKIPFSSYNILHRGNNHD